MTTPTTRRGDQDDLLAVRRLLAPTAATPAAPVVRERPVATTLARSAAARS